MIRVVVGFDQREAIAYRSLWNCGHPANRLLTPEHVGIGV